MKIGNVDEARLEQIGFGTQRAMSTNTIETNDSGESKLAEFPRDAVQSEAFSLASSKKDTDEKIALDKYRAVYGDHAEKIGPTPMDAGEAAAMNEANEIAYSNKKRIEVELMMAENNLLKARKKLQFVRVLMITIAAITVLVLIMALLEL